MIGKEDYTKYLSYDNGKGLLLSSNDVFILDRYQIDYSNCSSLKELIFLIDNYLDSCFDTDVEELEDVLAHLEESHYYQEVHK